jgi:hypothetical protein
MTGGLELLRVPPLVAVVVGRKVGRFFPDDPVDDIICFISSRLFITKTKQLENAKIKQEICCFRSNLLPKLR